MYRCMPNIGSRLCSTSALALSELQIHQFCGEDNDEGRKGEASDRE